MAGKEFRKFCAAFGNRMPLGAAMPLACATFLGMRVIAGRLRSRRLRVPPSGVRPTSDRVREALFSALGDLAEARVLDLFAGSGALGIEALSRGAREVVFVERAPESLLVLRGNLADLDLAPECEVMAMDAQRALLLLAQRAVRFDLVLLDPPYGEGAYAELLGTLRVAQLVAAGGLVVVERAKRNALEPPEGWLPERERAYGDTVLLHLRPDPDFGTPESPQEAPPQRDAE